MNLGPEEIIEFWFSEGIRPYWFRSTPTIDAAIRGKYQTVWERAASGALNHWCGLPAGSLALVIILDQFPLNMFRGSARSFSTEGQAIAVAAAALDSNQHTELDREQLVFLYMPFMHSEDLADQDRSVALFSALGIEENTRFAKHHREIIREFGRFPHRNQILGRDSTATELAYLASPRAFNG